MKGLSSIKRLALLALCCLTLGINAAHAQTINVPPGGLNYTTPISGSGTITVNFTNAGDPLVILNTGGFTGNIVLGANATPGTLQVYGGTIGSITDAANGSGLVIGGSPLIALTGGVTAPATGTVTIFGSINLPNGLTTVSSGFTLDVTTLGSGVFNDGTVGLPTTSVIGSTLSIGGSYSSFGGTFAIRVNGSIATPVADQMQVAGLGSIDAASRFQILATSNSGTTATIVTAAGGLTVTGGALTNVNTSPFLLSTLSQVGNSISLTTTPTLAPTQSLTILHNFGDGSVTNDGIGATGLLQGRDGNFYGTTYHGGSAGGGSVFKITPQGTETILHSFGDGTVTNDGYEANIGLIQGTDGNFYGTTVQGGPGGPTGNGTIFKITPQGAVTILHSFADGTVTNDGRIPLAGLIEGSDGNFYGTTSTAGAAGQGTVFKITPQGTVTILHNFGDLSVTDDGFQPETGLIQGSDGNFYGTTSTGGSDSGGVIFKITPQGAVTILHSFADGSVTDDGRIPLAGLIEGSDGNFYGATQQGGSALNGTAFKITPQGTVTILHSFGDGSVTNDGEAPEFSLIMGTDGNFYGTTFNGGAANDGAIFKMTPQGNVTILHSFADNSVANDGINPSALFEDSDGNFYGTTNVGGSASQGTVFELAPVLPNLSSPVTTSGNVSLPFTYQITGTNTPTNFTATNLPPGLSIPNAQTGLITGTPTTTGTYNATLTLTNASGSSNFPLTITIGALPAPQVVSILTAYGSVGAAFTYHTVAINKATSYAATYNGSATLPAGLSFDTTTGILSGPPTATGTFSIALTATNATGTSPPVTLVLKLFATPPTLTQEYNVMHLFGDGTVPSDGVAPISILQAFDGNFYGVTSSGGAFGDGAIYKMSEQGNSSLFYSFTQAIGGIGQPRSLLQAADGDFYGTTFLGQIFKLSSSGQLTILHYLGAFGFSNPLIQGADGNFYGTDQYGGSVQSGSVFKITPQGTFSILHSFADGSVPHDGSAPFGQLVQGSDGNFYGTTTIGGSVNGRGTVFKITPQGTLTTLHSFNDGSVTNDGAQPIGSLVLGSDGNIYGVTYYGGAPTGNPAFGGTIFKITPSGSLTILHDFAGGGVANDGYQPNGCLMQGLDGNFYGVTTAGGVTGHGTIFQMTPQGIVTIIHNFGDASLTNDGLDSAYSELIQSTEGNFYGTAQEGGFHPGSNNGNGIIYSIVPTQAPVHTPVFTGSAFATSGVFTPFTFTPKAAFGVSGSGVEIGNAVQPQITSGGIMDALVSLFVPQSIHKNFSSTNWTLSEQGVGSIPPNSLQPLYLNFDPTSGTISGTPTQPGTFALTITPSNAIGSGTPQAVTLYINVPPAISSAATATCAVGAAFSYQIATTPPADSYGATFLPGWLSIDTVTGIISGTAPAAGTYLFNTVATNTSGQTVQPVTLTVTGGSSSLPTITSSTVASGAVGNSFTYHIATAHTATSFNAFDLPVGLLFDEPSGTILGVPNADGFFQIPITATNASGSYASVLSLTILPPNAPTIASSLNALAAKNVAFSYALPAAGIVNTYTETGALPAGLMFNAATGTITGTPTATGTFPLSITIGNDSGIATSNLTLSVQLPANYGTWTTTYGVTGGANGAPYHDGVPNLLKYFCDVIPSDAVTDTDRAALPVVGTATIAGTDCQTLTFRQSALESGLAIKIQTSPDLHTWTTVATEPSASIVQLGTDSTSGDPIYQAQAPITSTPQFIRLNITQP